MSVVADFLKKSGVQYLATVGPGGEPKVRPFGFMLEEGGKLYFCTSNQKNVYKEMQRQPRIEICASGENNAWMRIAATAVFVDDRALKARVQDASSLVKGLYKTPDNPVFEVFYLADGVATIADFSGEPPRTYRL